MHAPSVEGTTQLLVVRDSLVVLSVVRMFISWKNFQRTRRVMVMGQYRQSSLVAPLNIVAPRGDTFVLTDEQTAYILSIVAKSKNIPQMLSLV